MPSQHDSLEQPIVSSSEAWHLSRAYALNDVMALLRLGKPGAARTLQGAVETIEREALVAWNAYFTEVGAPESVQGRPDAIHARFDDELRVPVVRWPDTENTMGDRWEFLDMPDAGDAPFVLTAPFRPVQLARLPEGSIVLSIADPRHSAAAALLEALECAGRDLDSAFAASDVDTAWRRLNQVISVYRQAAKLVYQRVLRPDDFHAWSPSLPARITLDRAVNLICQVGATARAHEMLAFHLVSHWMQAQADHVEGQLAAAERKVAYRQALSQAIDFQRQAVAPLNILALAQAGLDPTRHQLQVVFRPIPTGGPRLVAIPMRDGVVTPLTRPAKDPA